MFALWPAELSQPFMTDDGVAYPYAMFSPQPACETG